MVYISDYLALALFMHAPSLYLSHVKKRGIWCPFFQRFGFYESTLIRAATQRKPVWIHAVSVGEMYVALRLA